MTPAPAGITKTSERRLEVKNLIRWMFEHKNLFVVKPYLNGTYLIACAICGRVVDYGLTLRDAEDRVEILR